METKCPVDARCAAEISAMLTPPSPLQLQEYFEEIISERKCHGIEVKRDGNLSKGVYATMELKEGELILKDKILVGLQHVPNKLDCLVCGYCFQFIESVEYQIGRKLYLQSLGVPSCNGCDEGMDFSHFGRLVLCCFIGCKDDSHRKAYEILGECSSSSSNNKACLPEGVIEALMNGELVMPYSDKFPLPSTVPCPGGCQEAYYCSKSCAQTDWESSHSLLCTGERSESVSIEALSKFIQHATETNDIFLLAAKTIAFTILRYRKLKVANADRSELSLLLEAWKPISMGYKRRWWECISFPDDVDRSDDTPFRMQIQQLAFKLFEVPFSGSDLVVASPVEDYFLYIDDLPDPEKEKAENIARQLLDALGDDYSICCQGTAFYPLQSCMNHSCCPNAHAFKRDEDRDGQAAIITLKPILKGEEVTVSYIDEDLPFEDRQALLADYGFKCRCNACLEQDPNKK
ncbi:histone-lysine N-methyltransferase ATXR2 isoform X1 [Populus alba x Populus x berolinensis]|nr:histone-lysine N-methyltransferase ATXR2 isoform X1 [Populus alba x Populus x berolinensis]